MPCFPVELQANVSDRARLREREEALLEQNKRELEEHRLKYKKERKKLIDVHKQRLQALREEYLAQAHSQAHSQARLNSTMRSMTSPMMIPMSNWPVQQRMTDPVRNSTQMSQFMGVSFDPSDGLFGAHIAYGPQILFLGKFRSAEEAAHVHDTNARQLFGPGCMTNFRTASDGIEATRLARSRIAATGPPHDKPSERTQFGPKKVNTSRYRGVSYKLKDRKWVAQIRHQGQQHYLGIFKTQLEAARAYDHAAKKWHKEVAKLNFPNDENDNRSTSEEEESSNCETEGKQSGSRKGKSRGSIFESDKSGMYPLSILASKEESSSSSASSSTPSHLRPVKKRKSMH